LNLRLNVLLLLRRGMLAVSSVGWELQELSLMIHWFDCRASVIC
jgi:hypothetical protein